MHVSFLIFLPSFAMIRDKVRESSVLISSKTDGVVVIAALRSSFIYRVRAIMSDKLRKMLYNLNQLGYEGMLRLFLQRFIASKIMLL